VADINSRDRAIEIRRALGPERQSRLIDRLERYLDFERWGFELSYAKPLLGPVIYDSPMCRLKFTLSMERDGDEIATYYGRKHAPDDEGIIDWQGERCFCWHNLWVLNVTEFLEGYTTAQAVERRRNKLDTPERIAFKGTELGQRLSSPEWGVALEAFIWERYGEKLFSLFDLGQPNRWAELRRFVREYHEMRPRRSMVNAFGIPEWNIC